MKGSPLPILVPRADNALGVALSGFMDVRLVYVDRPKHTSIPKRYIMISVSEDIIFRCGNYLMYFKKVFS